MSEVLLSLSFAYVFLVTLVLLALIFSRLNWLIKAGLIVLCLFFYGLSYEGWKQAQGWPAQVDVPERFLLHYAVIEEPDKEAGLEGRIFMWLSDLHEHELAQQPRAYALEYDRDLHSKVAQAITEIEQGNLQLGIINPDLDLPSIETKNKRVGHKYFALEFVELPDPSLPEK